MRKFFSATLLFFFTSLFVFEANAQQLGFCGTGLNETQKEWLLDYVQNGRDFSKKSSAQYYVPLYFHIVGNDEGKGYYSVNQLMLDVCQLNRQYAPVGFYFYLSGVSYIDNSAYYDHNYSSGSSMMLQNNKPNVANIYVVYNPADNCGYFSPGRNGVAVGKSCMGTGATTLAHELGHFFSLPHPFTNVTGVKEYVNGTNCDIAGDLFCDTRADYLSTRWNCPYTGNEKDPLGDTYDPDETLYMSYSSDHCAYRFSLEQIDAMKYNINTQRTNLKGPLQDTIGNAIRAKVLWPDNNAAAKTNSAQLVWSSVPDAKWYILQVTQFSVFPGALPVDIITTDTTYIVKDILQENKTYRWRVRPIFPGRTCTEFSDTGIFVASSTASINSYDYARGITVYPNPASQNNNVFVAFDNEENAQLAATITTIDGKTIRQQPLVQQGPHLFTLSIEGLQAGFYFIDINNGSKAYRQKLLVE